jgi:hypothetical protein
VRDRAHKSRVESRAKICALSWRVRKLGGGESMNVRTGERDLVPATPVAPAARGAGARNISLRDGLNAMRDRIAGWLDSDKAGWLFAAVSFVLTSRSLRLGFQTDDHMHAYMSRYEHHPWSLFRVTSAEISVARQFGGLAWWSSPRLSVYLLRPLSSLTHAFEYRVWPNAAWAMHLGNCLLYAMIVVVAWQLYRQIVGPSHAGLAALLFTLAEGHAPSVGWIAARNSLLTSLFVLLALLTHLRARRDRSRFSFVLSSACTALALLSGEAGVDTLAYLFAYSLVFEPGTWTARLRSIAPQVGVTALWAALYVALGCGIRGASWYRDLGEPFALLRAGILDLPLWFFSLFGPGLVSVGAIWPAAITRTFAFLLMLPMLAVLWIVLPRNQANRFFAFGVLLCLPPLFATLPQDRLLLSASFAGCGLLASFLEAGRQHAQRAVRVAWVSMASLHLGFAPLLFLVAIGQYAAVENGTRAVVSALPRAMPSQVILVNTPFELLTLYAAMQFKKSGAPPATALQQLYAGTSPLIVERIDANTLELRASLGWGHLPIERVFCAAQDMPRMGSVIALRGMRASVLETNAAGMPNRVRFQFPSRLESSERAWFVWQDTRPVPWHPPAIGASITLPALSFVTSLEPEHG